MSLRSGVGPSRRLSSGRVLSRVAGGRCQDESAGTPQPSPCSATRRIHLVDLGDQPGPAWGAAAPGLRFGRDAGGVRLGAVGGASGAIRVLAVEQRTVLPRIRDVVTHAGTRASQSRVRAGHTSETPAALARPPGEAPRAAAPSAQAMPAAAPPGAARPDGKAATRVGALACRSDS